MKGTKRLLSALLALVMLVCVGVVPAAAEQGLTVVLDHPNGMEVDVGDGNIVTVDVRGGSGSYSYRWSVANTSMASIDYTDNYAYVEGKSAGSTTISVYVTDMIMGTSQSDTIALTVKGQSSEPLYCYVTDHVADTTVGEKTTVSVEASGGSGNYSYRWTSSNDSIAAVSGSGSTASVSGVAAGTATITVTVTDTMGNTDSDSLTVTVKPGQVEPLTVVITPVNGIEVGVNDSDTVQVDVRGGSGSYSYKWSVNDTSLANITGTGRGEGASISGRKAGSTTISVHVTDNSTGAAGTDTIALTVKSQPVSNLTVVITPVNSLSVGVGGSDTVRVDVRGGSGNYSYNWSVSNSSLANITGTGKGEGASVAGKKAGSTTINVNVTDNSTGAAGSDSIGLSVYDQASLTVVVTPVNGMDLSVSETKSASVNVQGGSGNYSYDWSVGSSRVAVVSGNGANATVKAVNSGDTTVSVRVTDLSTGATGNDTIYVSVTGGSSKYASYDPSDYCYIDEVLEFDSIADSIIRQFYYSLGVYPTSDATVTFSNTGNSVGVLKTANGRGVQANNAYPLSNLEYMYLDPSTAGTFRIPYSVSYNGYTLSGTISVQVESGLSVSLDPSSIRLETYSSHYIEVNVSPRNSYYTVKWESGNTNIVSIRGSGSSVTMESHGTSGSTTVKAIVTDYYGNKITKTCNVTVNASKSSTFNPTASATVGSNFVSTSITDSITSQFKGVYAVTLPNSANITFSSTGSADFGSLKLSNGSDIKSNTKYTIDELRKMYFVPKAAGTFTLPYTITYSSNTLNGSIVFVVSPATITASMTILNKPFAFKDAVLSGASGSSILVNAVNSVSGWSYLTFSGASDSVGTLYQNSYKTELSNNHITSSAMTSLYFVPVKTGMFSIAFTVCNTKNNTLAKGTLFINVTSEVETGFSDVPSNSYYSSAVKWAVDKGVTNGFTETIFGPHDTCTRGQVATFLWRASGKPEPKTTVNPFKDVDPASPFYKAILWAYENGITNGTTETTFDPSGQCTYGHTITFLWRAKNQPEARSASAVASANPGRFFSDAAAWADSNMILSGVGSGTFNGDKSCPRSDIVTYIYRAYQ